MIPLSYWQSLFAVCIANLISSFAVLGRKDIITVLELALRDLRCDENQEAIDEDYSGSGRARLRG